MNNSKKKLFSTSSVLLEASYLKIKNGKNQHDCAADKPQFLTGLPPPHRVVPITCRCLFSHVWIPFSIFWVISAKLIHRILYIYTQLCISSLIHRPTFKLPFLSAVVDQFGLVLIRHASRFIHPSIQSLRFMCIIHFVSKCYINFCCRLAFLHLYCSTLYEEFEWIHLAYYFIQVYSMHTLYSFTSLHDMRIIVCVWVWTK